MNALGQQQAASAAAPFCYTDKPASYTSKISSFSHGDAANLSVARIFCGRRRKRI
jgi:hypothetical protein